MYANREKGGSCQWKCFPIHFWKAYPDLYKEKGMQKWAGTVVKRGVVYQE